MLCHNLCHHPHMSEATTKCVECQICPSFRCRWSYFPVCLLPLHIFEPRYRQMLLDIRLANESVWTCLLRFTRSENEVPPAGHVGCVAEVTETQILPDGRSNILTLGVIRYRIESYVERGDPYLVAQVSYL